MAKKKKAAPKKGKPGRPRKPQLDIRPKPVTKPRRRVVGPPAQGVMPGMEAIRDATLDRLCEDIGGYRDQMSRLRADESADKLLALDRMAERKFQIYKHAKIELALIPGDMKLRVRQIKEETTPVPPSDAGQAVGEGVEAEGDEA